MKTKLDAIMHRMDKQEKRLHFAHEIGAVERDGIRRSVEGPIEEDPYQVEEAKYISEQRSYHFKPNPNLPTHYNLAQGTMRISHMVEEHHRAQDIGRISSKGINHQCSSNSSSMEKT